MTEPDLSPEGVEKAVLERFETAWTEGHPEPIEPLLPEPSHPSYLATLEALISIELECGWRSWAASAAPGAETVAGPPPLEVYLQRFPPLNRPEIVLRLVEHECRVRKQIGQTVTLSEYRRRFPDLLLPGSQSESILRSAIGGAGEFAMSATAGFGHSGTETVQAVPPRQLAPGRFGNYELLAEIGRGGMGVVYRARQCTADRIVALKVIRRDRLEALPRDSQTSALDRFRHEAQAAARLEHENIVTVYEVGEIGGEQFFSMRYVEGESLAELLRNGPMEGRRAAGYLEPVARAVHQAHVHGILHRDLKPQNILVDAKTGRALVADFGLAKLSEGAEELTRAGEVMGTPPYMSPEQARDSAKVTAMTDVYALGATLYHLVTGRPPFQAATPVETLRQVMDEEPVPPRQLNPSIDRDLETICVKCLEKEPPRRYDSAEALAEDLRRYLANEPIVARPISVFGRFVRWCRRNPIVAGLLGTAAVLAVGVVVSIIVGYVQTSAALTVAEERYRQARETVDKFCTRVSEDKLLNQPGMQPLQKELLEMALEPLQQFVEERADDPTVRDELAKAYFRVGRVNELIQSPEKAMPSYQQARRMQEDLVAETPDDTGRLEALGETLTAIGRTLSRQRKLEEALAAHKEAASVRTKLVRLAPGEGEFKRMLANSLMNMGIIQRETGRPEQARTKYEQAQALREEAAAAGFDSPELLRDLGMGYYNLARLAGSQRDSAEAEKNLREAVAVFEKLLKTDPRDLANQGRLIVCYRTLADVVVKKRERVEKALRAALTLLQGRLHVDPGDLASQSVLIACQGVLTDLASKRQEDRDSALDLYGKALRLVERLAWANPDVPNYQADLAGMCMNLGLLHGERGEPDAALESYRRALDILKALVDQSPKVARYREDQVKTLWVIADVLGTPDNPAACASLEAALEQVKALIQQFPENERYRKQSKILEGRLQAAKSKRQGNLRKTH